MVIGTVGTTLGVCLGFILCTLLKHYNIHELTGDIYYFTTSLPVRMEALDVFFTKTQENVTGTVKIKLYKGNVIILGRKSPLSLYWEELATFEKDKLYEQKDAEGFINLFGLPLKVGALKKKRN